MRNYIDMEFLKSKHSRLNKTMLSASILAAIFTIVWFLSSPTLDTTTVMATVQNNFSIIWIFILIFALVFEKIAQEKIAGNSFNIRSTILNIRTYSHALMFNLYWVFFKSVLTYELTSYIGITILFGPIHHGYIHLILLPIIVIMLYAIWLIPLIFILTRWLGTLLSALITFALTLTAIILPPLFTPWSLFTTTLSSIAGVARNGIATNTDNSSLLLWSIITFTIMLVIYELILKYVTKGTVR